MKSLLRPKALLLLCSLSGMSVHAAMAQCLSGDCKNGTGKYDFGYATYTGSFKNGKPEGQGTMDYGGGEKYTGGFRNGKEDGEGILYSASGSSKVVYREGFKVSTEKVQPVVVGGNKSLAAQPDNCISGDCVNGFGKMAFSSGNSYEGHFRNGKFQGQGEFRFASGNVLKARFDNHVPQEGSFYYAAQQTLFTGTLNPDATPRTGMYKCTGMDGEVDIVNGRIVAERHPERDRRMAEAAKHAREFQVCPGCGGKGEYLHTSFTPMKSERSEWTSWSPTGGYQTNVSYTTSGGFSQKMQPCPVCHGKGETKR